MGRVIPLGAGGGGSISAFVARLSADQTSGLNVNGHVEFDESEGDLATLSTGAGQSLGLVTIAQTGRYVVWIGMRAFCNEGSYTMELRDDSDDSPILDIAGGKVRIYATDNSPTDVTEHPGMMTVCDLTAGQVIKLDTVTDAAFERAYADHTNLTLLRIA